MIEKNKGGLLTSDDFRVLLFTETKATKAHGTGAALQRHLERFPVGQVLHVFIHDVPGECPWPSCPFTAVSLSQIMKLLLERRLRRLYKLSRTSLSRGSTLRRISEFSPNVVLGLPYSIDGIQALMALTTEFEIPLYLRIWDVYFDSERQFHESFVPAFHELLELAQLADCISERMLTDLSNDSSEKFGVQNIFSSEIVNCASRTRFANPRMALVGNVWHQASYTLLDELLRDLYSSHQDLEPVAWFCNEYSLSRLGLTQETLPPYIRYAGDSSGRELQEKLCEFSLCLVPFNVGEICREGYERYSIPSKFSELWSSGTPCFVIASEDTAISDYVKSVGAGIVCASEPFSDLRSRLSNLLSDEATLLKLSSCAKSYAENHFESDLVQSLLLNRLNQCLGAFRH